MFVASEVIRDTLDNGYFGKLRSTGKKRERRAINAARMNTASSSSDHQDSLSHPSTAQRSSWIRSLSPSGTFYRVWEFLGILLTISISLDIFIVSMHTGSDSGRVRYWTHPLTDIYFIIDIFIRFHTEYVDKATGELVTDLQKIRYRYFTSWFFVDLLLSLPYGFIRHCWEQRPAIRLLAMKENSTNSVKKLFMSRVFRQELFQTVRDHINERNYITGMQNFLSGNSARIPAMEKSRWRKAMRLSTSWYRVIINFRILSTYSSMVKSLISLAMSMRTLSLLSTSKRRD